MTPESRTYLLGPKSEGRAARQLAGMLALEARYLFATMFTRRRPEVIITRSPIPFGAMLVGRWLGVPMIKEIHTDIGDETPVAFAGRPMMKLGSRFLHHTDVWSARRADGIIFNNTALERHFRKTYLDRGAPTITIPNGTDTSTFRYLGRDRCRRELGLSEDRRYLVWAGAINPWHGVEQVVNLADALPPAHEVLVVGKATSAYAHGLIESSAGRRATFVGAVPPTVAAKYINAADLCLLPVADVRVSPGSPLKLYDYAACGTAVACQRDMEGYSDVVLDHGIGIAVDFGDPVRAALKIQEFLPRANALRDHIRQVAEDRFSWERRMTAWLHFAEEVRTARGYDE